MTSGTPSKALVYEEKNNQRTVSCPGRVLTSPYQSASLRVQTLGAIEERDSVVSFLDRRDYATEATSDVESLPGTESSGGVEGPSIGFRQQSVITAATSLTSASGSAPSPKALMSHRLSREHSWIDVDSDDDMDMDMDDGGANTEQAVALSPRPPSPLTSDAPFHNLESISQIPRCRTAPPQKPPSITGSFSRQHSLRSVDIPPRRTSLACTTTDASLHSRPQTPCPEPKSNSRKQRLSLHLPSHARYLYQVEPYPSLTPPPERAEGFNVNPMDGYDDDSIFDGNPRPLQRPSTVYIQNTPPPSPLPTVQAWLDHSNPPFVPQPPVEDLAKAVPLPPDIIETLRVSIACFPETMLLSSSLTIETIRAYSKKVRHPSTDACRESMGNMSPHHPQRSLWKKVVSTGRESISTCLHRAHLHHDGITGEETSYEPVVCPSAWVPLRHVFGTCSDYICDALYAHIVAYNYMSRVPRGQSTTTQRVSTSSSKRVPNDDIPKKAASLLGLDSPQRPAQPTHNVGRIAKKFSTPLTSLGFGKDDMAGTSSAAQDNATRNIEAGLLRCIMRLIATARMMAEEGRGEESLMEVEAQNLDMIFVRSLCEIVRISEEAM